MAQQDDYTKYAVLAQVDKEVQNAQELSTMWGDIENECEELGVTVEHAYAALGQYDFLMLIEAPTRDQMFKASLVLTRYGLDVETLDIIPTEQFANLVTDF